MLVMTNRGCSVGSSSVDLTRHAPPLVDDIDMESSLALLDASPGPAHITRAATTSNVQTSPPTASGEPDTEKLSFFKILMASNLGSLVIQGKENLDLDKIDFFVQFYEVVAASRGLTGILRSCNVVSTPQRISGVSWSLGLD
jgi:hypothetical protein